MITRVSSANSLIDSLSICISNSAKPSGPATIPTSIKNMGPVKGFLSVSSEIKPNTKTRTTTNITPRWLCKLTPYCAFYWIRILIAESIFSGCLFHNCINFAMSVSDTDNPKQLFSIRNANAAAYLIYVVSSWVC